MRLKKLLLFFIVQLSFNVAYAKDFSVEDVKMLKNTFYMNRFIMVLVSQQ